MSYFLSPPLFIVKVFGYLAFNPLTLGICISIFVISTLTLNLNNL